MGRIEAVLWDFGGVFLPSPFSHLVGLAPEVGVDPDRMLELVFGPYDEDTDHPWHRMERGELAFDEANELLIAAAAADGHDFDPIALLMRMGDAPRLINDDVLAVAQRLRADGYRTAIVTNNIAEFRDGWRSLVDVDSVCEVIVDSSVEGVRKPGRRIFELALERLGDIPPDRAVFLDDAPGNVAAAQELGMHAILVTDDVAAALAELEEVISR
jgi:epoxide hydrolase-like predicted phosphatase